MADDAATRPDNKVNQKEVENAYFGEAIYGPGKRFFDDPVIDNILEALMELSAQVWVERDRRLVLESVLQEILEKQYGVDLVELVEQHRPSEELQDRRRREREDFALSVFNSFSRHLDPNEAD